jgi:hypothetical protein
VDLGAGVPVGHGPDVHRKVVGVSDGDTITVLRGREKIRLEGIDCPEDGQDFPLTLPVLGALLSIMLNVREMLKPHGLLRLPTAVSLGLVSFAIWYVVAAQSTQEEFIRIGSSKLLNKDYAVLLVIVAFIWAAFCAVARIISESYDDAARHGRIWRIVQTTLLAGSIVAVGLLYFLFEQKKDVEKRLEQSLDDRYFTVSIAYRDYSLNQHVGRTGDPITQCFVLPEVLARTEDDAVDLARATFRQSPANQPQFLRGRDTSQTGSVEIVESWIVAERKSAFPRKKNLLSVE